jgi:hypothetical protein
VLLLADRSGRARLCVAALKRENRELRQANEILHKAAAYFAHAELGRRSSDNRLRRRPPGRLHLLLEILSSVAVCHDPLRA